MNPQVMFWSRVIRLLILLVMAIWLLSGGNGLNYLFAAVCAILMAVTGYQIWASHQRGET